MPQRLTEHDIRGSPTPSGRPRLASTRWRSWPKADSRWSDVQGRSRRPWDQRQRAGRAGRRDDPFIEIRIAVSYNARCDSNQVLTSSGNPPARPTPRLPVLTSSATTIHAIDHRSNRATWCDEPCRRPALHPILNAFRRWSSFIPETRPRISASSSHHTGITTSNSPRPPIRQRSPTSPPGQAMAPILAPVEPQAIFRPARVGRLARPWSRSAPKRASSRGHRDPCEAAQLPEFRLGRRRSSAAAPSVAPVRRASVPTWSAGGPLRQLVSAPLPRQPDQRVIHTATRRRVSRPPARGTPATSSRRRGVQVSSSPRPRRTQKAQAARPGAARQQADEARHLSQRAPGSSAEPRDWEGHQATSMLPKPRVGERALGNHFASPAINIIAAGPRMEPATKLERRAHGARNHGDPDAPRTNRRRCHTVGPRSRGALPRRAARLLGRARGRGTGARRFPIG